MSSWIKLFTSLNVFVFRLSNGRIGNKLGKQSVLVLNTIGRKSGKTRATTLSYYRDNNNYLLVASNWGKENQPDWLYNLRQQPHTTIQVGSKTIMVEAHQAQDNEYQRLWQLVTEHNNQYIEYQKGLKRRIPIIILAPIDEEPKKNSEAG